MSPRYMRRTMNTYPVSDTEMEIISSLSAEAAIDFGISTFIGGLAAGIWTNSIFYSDITPAGTLAVFYVAPILTVGAITYLVRAIFAQRRRNNRWENIKKNSEPIRTQTFTATRDIF